MKRILLLSALSAWFFVAVGSLMAQRTISGTVTDDLGEGLPGVNVVIKGTTIGVTTGLDGSYQIPVEDGATLIFSYVGFETQEIVVGSRTTIDVTLSGATELQEVIVLGYGDANRNEITGSAVQLGEEKIAQMPMTSVDQVLQGNVAGLQLSGTSGTPGSTQQIRIRGMSSINASNAPLFVIDGVPVSSGGLQRTTSQSTFNPLASINPNNIQSITVLKDPASTAPYGARGTNGVIVITTKTGQSGKTEISFAATYGVQNDAMEGPKMLTAAQREELMYEAIFNTYGASQGLSNEDDAREFYLNNPNIFGTTLTDWNADGRPETDWQSVITNDNAPIRSFDLSLKGGNQKTNYFASLGYFDQEATVIGSSFDRINGTLNLTNRINENFTLITRNTVSYSEQDGLLEQSAFFSGPRTAKYFAPPTARPYNKDGSINITNLHSNIINPLWIANNDFSLSRVMRITSNNTLSWDTPIDNLSFDTRVAIDLQTNNFKRYQNRTHGDAEDVGGAAAVLGINRTNMVFQNSASYSMDFDRHNFDFKVVQEFQTNKDHIYSAGGESIAADGLTNVSSTGTPTDATSAFSDWYIGSYLGLVNYNYDSKYLLNASFRREGNSRFPGDSRWGSFYAIGVGWNIHEEAFLSGVTFVDNLKLRSSFGVTGNAGIGLNQYQAALGFDVDYNGEAGIYPSSLGNQNLQWEKAQSYEIGLDFGLLDNKITGLVNYYRRETKDMLLNVPLSRTTGFTSQTQNIGRMENKGFELELTGVIIDNNDLFISIGGNLGTNANKVLELAKDGNGEEINITTGTRRVTEGRTVYEWFMVGYAGVNPDNGDALYWTDETKTEKTNDFNAAERAFQGKGAIPTLIAGINLNVKYKGVFLDVQGNYSGGHAVWEPWTRYIYGSDRHSFNFFNGVDVLMNRWQKPGDITDVPRMQYRTEPWQTHSRFLRDGDFFRLRNVTIGYDFNQSLLESLKLTNARVFVRGINLWTWVKDPGLDWDPEMAVDGFGSLTTPPVKTLTLGMNVTF